MENIINKYLKLDKITEKNKFSNQDSGISKLLDSANSELEKYYTGNMRFNLCIDKEGMTPDNLKISPKKKRKIKEIWLKFDSELSKIQRQFEKVLQESLQNKKDII